MASQNQRLRRLAEKAARRKVTVAEKRKAEMIEACGRKARQISDASLAPITTCVVSRGLFDDGIGWVVLARTMPSGLIGACFFLVDVWCLGVKDAFFRVLTWRDFEDQLDATSENHDFINVDPSVARKLLHDAAAYASSFGLAPSEDFAAAERIFGDTPMGEETFAFGRDGEPYYVPGPNDSSARARDILDALAMHAGPSVSDCPVEGGRSSEDDAPQGSAAYPSNSISGAISGPSAGGIG